MPAFQSFAKAMKRTWAIRLLGLSLLVAPVASRAADIQLVAKNLQFPEGTIFVGNELYFVDYATSDVLRLVDGKVKRVWHQDGCGANGLLNLSNTLLVACYSSGNFVKISLDGKVLNTIRKDDAGTTFTNPNDLAADTRGGVYVTTSGSGQTDRGKIFYLAPGGTVKEVASDIHFANGIAVSPDGKRLYVVETNTGRLLSFTIGPDGSLTERQEFANLAGILGDSKHKVFHPDSMRIDRHGNLFVALYDGGGYAVFDPAGKLIEHVDLPAPHHTNLAISPDGKSIYVTAVYDSPGGYNGEIYRVPNPVAE